MFNRKVFKVIGFWSGFFEKIYIFHHYIMIMADEGVDACDSTTQRILNCLCCTSPYIALIPVAIYENNCPLKVEEIENKTGKFPHTVLEILEQFGIIYRDAKGVSLTAIRGITAARYIKEHLSVHLQPLPLLNLYKLQNTNFCDTLNNPGIIITIFRILNGFAPANVCKLTELFREHPAANPQILGID